MYSVAVILFFVSTILSQTSAQCVYPCSWQNRVYNFVVAGSNMTFERAVFSPPGNLTNALTYLNGKDLLIVNCVHRSGPFIVLRFYNGTDWLYRCNKDTHHGTNRDTIVIRTNDWVAYSYVPNICEVCNGVDYFNTLSLVGVDVEIELECNIPAICPVKQPGQIQCTGCTYDGDGLCC